LPNRNPRDSAGRPNERRRSQHGFALLLVIWALSLLTVLAVTVLTDTRTGTLLIRNQIETTRARDLAQAGIALAIDGLLDPNPTTRWHNDGRARQIAYDGGKIAVTIVDEDGKVDLNLAPLDFLDSLFASRGIEQSTRGELIAEIERRRREVAPQGVPLVGLLPNQPTLKAFNVVEDLRALPGMTRAAFEAVRPLVTVYSQTGHVNPLTASREVLSAVPGISPVEVETILSARASFGNGGTIGSLPALTNIAQYLGYVGATGAATVTATGVTARGISFTREAVVAISSSAQQPYRILQWRQPISGSYAASAEAR
jgi:general secretion pathway protein K